jgi:hypothetical protein
MTEPHGITCRHAFPGAPIEIMRWSRGMTVNTCFISDAEALRLVADLSRAVLANTQAETAQELDGKIRREGTG